MFSFRLYPQPVAGDSDSVSKAIGGHLHVFQTTHAPIATISLAALPQFNRATDLIDPSAHNPHPYAYDYAAISGTYAYARTCKDPPVVHGMRAEKLLLWTRFLCGDLAKLPEAFLNSPPFVHPSGSSYALLIWTASSRQTQWNWDRLKPFFHLLELQSAKQETLSDTERLWAELSPSQVEAVYFKAPVAIGPTYLLLSSASTSEAPALNYAVYRRADWQAAIAQSLLAVDQAKTNLSAAATVGNMVVTINAEKISSRRSAAIAWASGSVVVLLLCCAFLWLSLLRLRRHEARQQLFNLRMLSHELRTPATAIKLNLESLREKYDELTPPLQAALLDTMAAEGRLGSVLDASVLYLRAGAGQQSTAFERADCPSVNAFLLDVLAKYANAIVVEPSSDDFSARIDHYLVNFCVATIVDNALKHGRPPVRVSWRCESKAFFVLVEDQGNFSVAAFNRARRPFGRSSSKAGGLGLGLSLVYRVLKELGGKLTFTASPSTFKLRFTR